jgi:hypothetical protein
MNLVATRCWRTLHGPTRSPLVPERTSGSLRNQLSQK